MTLSHLAILEGPCEVDCAQVQFQPGPALQHITQLTVGELQAGLTATAEKMKTELGEVVTGVHASIADINKQLRDNTTAGERLMSAMENQKAETVTQVEALKAGAQSEFNAHRAAIESVVAEVRGIQQSLQTLAGTMQGELDAMKVELASAARLINGGGTPALIVNFQS